MRAAAVFILALGLLVGTSISRSAGRSWSRSDAPAWSSQGAEPGMLSAVRTELDRLAETDAFSGAVLVAKDGAPLFSGAYGFADRERSVSNTLETRFRLGSMNKMFTAVATLQLAEKGTVALDRPLGTYLPDYPNAEVASRVTLHHLLTHRGGTGDIFDAPFRARRLELRTHDDYLALYGHRPLLFTPGAEWRYSNYGFVLLGAVIERVSGRSYYEYVRDHVYAPAGMTASGSDPEEHPVPGRSTGYTKPRGATAWIPNRDTLPYRGTAAGGGYSTVGDLLEFATALRSHRLLGASATSTLTTGQIPIRGGKYAYGFLERTIRGARTIGHSGGAPGMNGELLIFPDDGFVVIVLANLDPPVATRLATFIAERLPLKGVRDGER